MADTKKTTTKAATSKTTTSKATTSKATTAKAPVAKAVSSNFDPARFRMGEEGDIAVAPESPAKAQLRNKFTADAERVNANLDKAESDLDVITKQINADIIEADNLAKEADLAAREAEKQMEEANKLNTQAEEQYTTAFNMDQTAVFSGLTKNQQSYVSKGMFGGNAALTAAFNVLSSIGVEGLMSVMEQIRTAYPDISADDALLLLKFDKRYNEPYLQRFSGNRKRMQAGLAPLDDQTYLANEAAYGKIFTSYGLNQFANRDRYSNFIGNDIAPDEVAERVQTVYNRVNRSIPQVAQALLKFYPELTTQDLMAYVLDPQQQLPAIQRKVQAAEIGGAALAQKLGTSLNAATFTGAEAAPYSNVTRGTIGVESMQRSGATADMATKASAFIADVLQPAEKLSAIYGGRLGQYGQLEAEQEAYLSSVEAKKKREALVGAEKAAFSGEAGMLRSQRRATGGLI